METLYLKCIWECVPEVIFGVFRFTGLWFICREKRSALGTFAHFAQRVAQGFSWTNCRDTVYGPAGNASVNTVDSNGNSLLHTAAAYGYYQLIEIFIKYGADIHRRGYYGMLPIHLACMHGHHECFRLLLNVAVKTIETSKNDLLMEDVQIGENITRTTSLFNVNVVDDLGRSCLHTASIGGNVGIVNLLVESGASLEMSDNDGRRRLNFFGHIARASPMKDHYRAFKAVIDRPATGLDSTARPSRTIMGRLSGEGPVPHQLRSLLAHDCLKWIPVIYSLSQSTQVQPQQFKNQNLRRNQKFQSLMITPYTAGTVNAGEVAV
ncbi:hypothetical protein HELRODRAFT_176127 [Helobdella robusta]|uniref:Uncharacterized protein n=1 Tax=Helobdella robusta TaxID=6412 RepID=T1FA64_HELRO|nr:hypothetical protein HELRODRAFT_176127 [Helobdella robusta]ESO00268.1 hypothetical protein HELRODRAFT_176127 [Helobdella robusta]